MAPWKKTFYSAFFAQMLSIMGFSFAMPFLPFYIRELGVHSESELRMWAGIATAAPGITLAIFQPLWGVLSDRYGRKVMVIRSMFGGAIVLVLMAFVQNVGQLVVCRLLQGVVTGTVAASVALVASVTPQRRSGYTLGMMQAAVFAGFSIGPLIGGIVADWVGYRMAFIVSAFILVAGGLVVNFGAREEFTPPEPGRREHRRGFAEIFAASGFLAAVLVLCSIRFSNTIANPAFPLIVESLYGGKAPNAVTGSIFACAGVAAAFSAGIFGRFSDRWGHKRMLVIFSLSSAAVSIAHAFARTLAHLFVLRACFGLTVAGMAPAANALIRRTIHDRHIGKAYGVATSISSIGWFFGPLTGGYLAARLGLRAPFIVTGIAQILVSVIVILAVKTILTPPDQTPPNK